MWWHRQGMRRARPTRQDFSSDGTDRTCSTITNTIGHSVRQGDYFFSCALNIHTSRTAELMWPAQLSEKIQNWKILFSEKPNVQKIMLSEKSRIWKLSFQKNKVFRKILLSENLVSAVYVRFTRADWHRNNHPVVRYRYGIAARVIIAYRDTTRFIILLFMDNSGDKRNRIQFPR